MDSLFGDLPPEKNADERDAKRMKREAEGEAAAAELLKRSELAAYPAEVKDDAEPERQERQAAPAAEAAAATPSPAPSQDANDVDTAIQRITAHISNPKKFKKCASLALQLLEGDSLTRRNNKSLMEMLRAAMTDKEAVTAPSFRVEYQQLFRAAQKALADGIFNAKQKRQLEVWFGTALLANSLHTDDSYVFTKAINEAKAALAALPDLAPPAYPEPPKPPEDDEAYWQLSDAERAELAEMAGKAHQAECRMVDEEHALASEWRDALITCLEVAFSYYRWAWAQTAVDMSVFAAHEAREKFSEGPQRERLQQVYEKVRDAKNRRQGIGSGKDKTSFEIGQDKYKDAAISIRKPVGNTGADGRGDSCTHRLGGSTMR